MAQPTWIGRSLSGRYQIEALLGQGGMSAVYKATDPNLKRVVAIKLIHSHLSSDQHFIERFEEEAAAVASLRHPNIVQVYDYNSDEGTHYMVLEYVPGETLQDRLQHLSAQGRTLDVKEAIKYMLNMCDALGYAHQRGMIHRDIKPANIMLDVYGQAILMDFGIVKILGGTSHTATGAVLGTARYISPEVIRSQPADQRSDIYSLGVTMYEMLSGQPPFRADSTMSLMMMHLNDPVPDPRMLRADLSNEIVNVMMRCLEKDRDNRYQSAAELAADLKYVLAILNGSIQGEQPRQPAGQYARTLVPGRGSPEAVSVPPAVQKPISQPVPQPVYQQPAQPTTTVWNTSQSVAAQPAAKKTNMWLWVAGLGAAFIFFILIVLIGGVLMMSRQFANVKNTPIPATQSPIPAQPTVANTQVIIPIALPTDTPLPATAIPVASPTYPPYYVKIDNITKDGSKYSVEYETFGFVEKLPFMHVHFFFNNVPPEEAGIPGLGPWIMYGGPRPFTGYSISQRPEGVTQICALVANANHTVIPLSGNCYNLP